MKKERLQQSRNAKDYKRLYEQQHGKKFKHHFTSMWDEFSYVVVWTFFGIAFLWDWNENWPFPVLWPLLILPTQGTNPGLLHCRQTLYHLTNWGRLNSSWAISNLERWCCGSTAVNMSANLENSAMATGLEKVSFHSNPKERQCKRMLKLLHNYTHLTC